MDYRNMVRIIKTYARRNHIILANLNMPVEERAVNLHWWELPGAQQNVGDMLSPVVVGRLCNKNNILDSATLGRTSHLYAIGSIIDSGYQDAVVWGSGLLRGKDRYWWRSLRKLDIRAVRGPHPAGAAEKRL